MDIHGQQKTKQPSAQKLQEGGCRRKKKTHHRTSAQSDSTALGKQAAKVHKRGHD